MMIALLCATIFDVTGMDNDFNIEMIQRESLIMFVQICNCSIPHSVKFKDRTNVVLDLSTHEGKRILKSIREDDYSRPIDFTVQLSPQRPKWHVTAGCKRKSDFSLNNIDSTYPYQYNGITKPINYVFGYKEGQLKDNNIPSGGPTYTELLRGFTSPKEIHDMCKQVADFLILKPQLIEKINEIDVKTAELIGLLMTSEYMRGRQALAVARIGHLYLKWHPGNFIDYKKIMIYPDKNGAVNIMSFSHKQMNDRFTMLWQQSPYSSRVASLPIDVQDILKTDFFVRQLNKIKMIYSDFLSEEFYLIVPIPGKFRDVVKLMISIYNDSLTLNIGSEKSESSDADVFDPRDPCADGHHESIEFRDCKSISELKKEFDGYK